MKRRAIAISAVYQNPFQEAFDSAGNFLMLAADKMYGTPERVRVTYACAVLLTILAMILSSGPANALAVCPS